MEMTKPFTASENVNPKIKTLTELSYQLCVQI